jgi:cytochrome-b5 reductase
MTQEEKLTPYKISDIINITHDTRQFTFAIPEDGAFDYLPGDFIKVFPDPSDHLEYRPYTPTSTPETKGYFQLIIKQYGMGPTSRFMHERKVGDTIWVSGPHEGGHFSEGMATRIGMVACGTGITPMISIIRTVILRRMDVSISLIFGNKTIDDIILRDEFDSYAEKHSNFKRYYVLSRGAPNPWTMGTGRIDKNTMQMHLPPPSEETLIFLCGPPMMQIELHKKLAELGYEKKKIIIP